MTNENEKRGVDAVEKTAKRMSWVIAWLVYIFIAIVLLFLDSRADSTFVAIEKAKPGVEQK